MRRAVATILNIIILVVGGILYSIGYLTKKAVHEPFVSMAGIAAVIYSVFAYNQWQIMRGQLDEMKADNRAWVSADLGIPREFVFDPANPVIELTFHYKNSGKSPAMGVKGMLDAIPLFEGTTAAVSKLKAACDNVSAGIIGFPLFPGDSVQGNISTKIPTTNDPMLRHILNPIILTCIGYTSTGGGNWHFTGRSLKLSMKAPRLGKGCCAIDVAGGAVSAGELKLEIWEMKGGNFAN